MKFEVDKQTKKDLEIFDLVKNGTSVFRLFDYTRYLGGRRKLYSFLAEPMADIDAITERKEAIAFLQKYFPLGFQVDKDSIDFTEYYYKHGRFPSNIPSRFVAMERMWMSRINMNNDYFLVESGVTSIVEILKATHEFFVAVAEKAKDDDFPKLLLRNKKEVDSILSRPEFAEIVKMKKVTAYDIARFDYLFRQESKDEIKFFLNLVYEYDVFYSVGKAAKEYGMTFAEVVPASDNKLEIEGLFHPFVKGAIPNDTVFGGSSNLLFVSGPNMAGKSTFLKALGLSVYLAHAGFPVPAKKMSVSILSGLCTTINISDNY